MSTIVSASDLLGAFFSTLSAESAALMLSVRASEEAAKSAFTAAKGAEIASLESEVAALRASLLKQTGDLSAVRASDATLRAELSRVAARNTVLEGKLTRLLRDITDDLAVGDGPVAAPGAGAGTIGFTGAGAGAGAGGAAEQPSSAEFSRMNTSPGGVVAPVRTASQPPSADASGLKRNREALSQQQSVLVELADGPPSAAKSAKAPVAYPFVAPIGSPSPYHPVDADVTARVLPHHSTSKKGRVEGAHSIASQPPALAGEDYHNFGAGEGAQPSLPPLGGASQGAPPSPPVAAMPLEVDPAVLTSRLRLVRWTDAPSHVGLRRDAVFPLDTFSLILTTGVNEIGRTTLNLSDTKISRKQIELEVSDSNPPDCTLVVKGLNATYIIRDGSDQMDKVDKDSTPQGVGIGDSIVFSTTPAPDGTVLPKPGSMFVLLQGLG